MAIRIESAGAEHLAAISALAGVIWRACYPGIISPEQIEFMLRWMYDVDVMRGELWAGVKWERLLINDALCGFAAHSQTLGGEWLLHKLYIHPEWQRRGLGRRLLEHVSEVAKTHQARAIVLGVNKRNDQAIAAYRQYGFVIRESILNEIGGGFVMDDYIMVMSLS
jgi:ribosomal protein S18 acetylase RimI-like enzyme